MQKMIEKLTEQIEPLTDLRRKLQRAHAALPPRGPRSPQFPQSILEMLRIGWSEEIRDYCAGMMMGVYPPQTGQELPRSAAIGKLQRSLSFWRGVADVKAYIAMINASTPPGAPPEARYQTPTFDMGGGDRPLGKYPVDMLHLFVEALTASEGLDVADADKLQALADRGRIATTGRLAQKVVNLLYPPDLICIVEPRRAVVETIRAWALPIKSDASTEKSD
jgi:hypothetical protein